MANKLLSSLVENQIVSINKNVIHSKVSKHQDKLSVFIKPLYRKNGSITLYQDFINVICEFIPIDLIVNDKVKKIIKNGNSSGAGNMKSGVKFFLENWHTIL